jgi:hypothetical protein
MFVEFHNVAFAVRKSKKESSPVSMVISLVSDPSDQYSIRPGVIPVKEQQLMNIELHIQNGIP